MGKILYFSDFFSLFLWKDLSAKEKKWILSKKNKPGWYEDYLSPFLIENPEPLNSLDLKYTNNKRMTRFYEKRMKPYAESINKKVKRTKYL